MSRRRLGVDGRVLLRGPGARLCVEGRQDRLVIDARDRRSLWRLWRLGPGGDRQARLRQADAWLRFTGLRAEVCLRRRVIARLGAGVRPGRLARWLGAPALQLRPAALILSLAGIPGRGSSGGEVT